MTVLYSEQPQTTDFITIKGIRTRLGLEKKELGIFIIRELIDNALDFIESNAKEFVKLNRNPYIHLIASEEEEPEIGKVTKITLRSSNPIGIDVFTEDQVKKIFDFDNYYSSKRNQYHISRGALGGAFKEILGIPYALAVEDSSINIKNYEDWKYPLQINISNKRLIDVRIEIVDKIRKKIRPEIDKKTPVTTGIDKDDNDYIEIITYIPTKLLDYKYINSVFKEYVLINTHIDFKSKFADSDIENEYEATQPIKDWKNKQSIYYYSLNEFTGLIHSFESSNDSLNVYEEFIHTDFREGYTLEKTKDFETLTFGDLKRNDSKIENIYHLLKDNVPSIRERQSTSLRDIELPFDIKQNIRSKALCERFEQVFFGGLDGFAYKRIDGYFGPEDNNPVEFPFIVEIFLVETSEYEKRLCFFPSVNLTPSIYYNSFDDEDRNNKIFTFKTSNNNNNEIESSHAITEILSKCGFSFDKKKHRKSINFVFINLISPRIEYKTGGKINLELKPFGSIAQDLYKFCKSPNIKGKNNKKNERPDSIRQELKYLIEEERICKVESNPDFLKIIDRWTQSTTFYTLRKILIDLGYRDVDKKRKYITRIIKDACEDLGYKRHELGIIAAERAQLYFDGQVLGVSFDQLEELMKKGTDLLVIEKEGIADVLMRFANSLGIAILNSRGFLTEYATELSDLAGQNGCNIAILTDWDSSGLLISSNLPNAYRIGIDFKTLEKFGLRKEDVEEKVLQQHDSDNHLKNLKKLSREQIPSPYSISDWKQMIKYLEGRRRIEIDSVIARVGSKVFWDFIIKELSSKFSNRNYNRSIDIPEYVSPKIVGDFFTNIQNKISELQSEERQKIKSELENTEGFLDLNRKKAEIENALRSIAQEKIDEITQFISDEFKKKFSSTPK